MTSSSNLKCALLASSACALALSLAHAQTTTPASAPVTPNTSQSTQITATTTAPLETLLTTRGTITLDDLLRDSGLATANLTPEARIRLEKVLNERNEDVRRANAHVADELRRALNVSDVQIAKSISDEDERRRMERIRKFQPKRYEALIRQQRKAQAKQQDK